jgi:hypothetical protein
MAWTEQQTGIETFEGYGYHYSDSPIVSKRIYTCLFDEFLLVEGYCYRTKLNTVVHRYGNNEIRTVTNLEYLGRIVKERDYSIRGKLGNPWIKIYFINKKGNKKLIKEGQRI